MRKDIKNCVFCGKNINTEFSNEDYSLYCECPVCGQYRMTKTFMDQRDYFNHDENHRFASYLFYKKKALDRMKEEGKERTLFLGTKEEFERASQKKGHYIHVTKEIVNNWYPKTFNEKINKMLLAFGDYSPNYGATVNLDMEQLVSCLFIDRNNPAHKGLHPIDAEEKYIFNFLHEQGYVDNSLPFSFCLMPKGWQRIDEIQEKQQYDKDVFVSMSFADKTKETREAIRTGIINAGYSPEFLDEVIHNKQIVPEMFRLIRECQFLILEISDPNYGAYYEAGYALGLGKEVIITCSAEVFHKKYETEEEKKFARYLRPHFDISQKQILVWDNYDDLTNKLSEWIKALIG